MSVPQFWEFKYRFNSLFRSWALSRQFFEKQFELLQQSDSAKRSSEFWHIYEETVRSDQEYIPEYLRLSTLSGAIALVEDILAELAESMASEYDMELGFEYRKMPTVNRFILLLTRVYGLDLSFDANFHKRLDAIREMRNRFLHRISRGIPSNVQKTITDLMGGAINGDPQVDDEFVEQSFRVLADLVKNIEVAYIEKGT